MSGRIRVAAVQMTSVDDVGANLQTAENALTKVAGEGAVMVSLPENFAFMGRRERDKLPIAEVPGDGPVQRFLSEQARAHHLWIVAGSIFLRVDGDPDHVHAACLVFDELGNCRARYDKMHLFDVEVDPEAGERYRESATIRHGEPSCVVVDTPAGPTGLSICYDLRFPEQYRALSASGAEVLLVPSAFTAQTGAAHWAPLLRARAIENQCYVIAANQCGTHPGQRRTWGHSIIVDPWGRVLAEAADVPDVIFADVDREALQTLRQRFPALQHRRLDP